jgi:hypothetical protein
LSGVEASHSVMAIHNKGSFIPGYFFKPCHKLMEGNVKPTDVAKFTLIIPSYIQKLKGFFILNPFVDFFVIDFHS